MKSYRHNGTLLVSVTKDDILSLVGNILEELEKNGIFEGRNIFRNVKEGCTEVILNHGTDRTEEKNFEYWLKDRRNQLKVPFVAERIGEVDLEDADEACLECRNNYSFEDIVGRHPTRDDVRLLVMCPYQERTKLINIYGEHFQCPTYMQVSGSPQVFWGEPSDSRDMDIRLLRESFDNLKADKMRFTHQLIYDANSVEDFDVERFRFKDGMKPAKALKCIIEYAF